MSKDSPTTKPMLIRPSSTLLWISILAGPVAFAIDMQSRFALVQWACFSDRGWVLEVITVTAFIAAAGAAIIGWLAFVRFSADDVRDYAVERARFMALSGFILGAIFALSIIANDLPHIFLSTCD